MQDKPIELLKKANLGDKTAYEQLLGWLDLHCHERLKIGLAPYRNFPKEAFDDITQEVLITFHTSHQTFDLERPLIPWLNAIIKYKMIDFMRRKDFVVMMTGPDLELIKDVLPMNEEDSHDSSSDLSVITEGLSPQQFEILRLAKIEGYSSKEIADELEMTDSNVKVSLHRTLKKLKKLGASLNTHKR